MCKILIHFKEEKDKSRNESNIIFSRVKVRRLVNSRSCTHGNPHTQGWVLSFIRVSVDTESSAEGATMGESQRLGPR